MCSAGDDDVVKTEVMSRQEARSASTVKSSVSTVIVSITDCGKPQNTFYPADWLVSILHIQFDDVEFGGKNCITKGQAVIIADFVLNHRKKADRIIVHCEFGQSRSAAVAAAVSRFLNGNDGGIFYNRRYNPNKTCYNYVLEALKKRAWVPKFLRG